MIELVWTSYIGANSEFVTEVGALLNDAFPDGAPNELSGYYSRHGIPTATMLLREGPRTIGHLAIYERLINIGNASLQVGMLGEIAVAADRRRTGLARRLVRDAHAHLQERSIPFSILFAYDPRVYVSSGYKLNLCRTKRAFSTRMASGKHSSIAEACTRNSWANLGRTRSSICAGRRCNLAIALLNGLSGHVGNWRRRDLGEAIKSNATAKGVQRPA